MPSCAGLASIMRCHTRKHYMPRKSCLPGMSSWLAKPWGKSAGKVPSRKYRRCKPPALFCCPLWMALLTLVLGCMGLPEQCPLFQDPSCIIQPIICQCMNAILLDSQFTLFLIHACTAAFFLLGIRCPDASVRFPALSAVLTHICGPQNQ